MSHQNFLTEHLGKAFERSHVYGSLGQVSREREVGPKFETDDETRGGGKEAGSK